MKKLICWLVATGLALVATAAILDHLFPFPEHKLTPPSSTRVLDRHGQPLRYFLASDDMWRFPVTLDQVAPDFITALIASEDRHFYHHPGVNPFSALRSLWLNIRYHRTISGASTIPMQLARLADPKSRTWKAKIIESFRAIQLCFHYSKEQILTWYINLTPYGANVVGVGAAAWYYFDKTPQGLSLGEIALLTVLPRAPNRYNPIKHPEKAKEVRNRVLRHFGEQNIFESWRIAQSLERPLLAKRAQIPRQAPHFSYWLYANSPAKAVISSTLDSSMQSIAEKQVQNRIDSLRREAIGNVAVVVLDTRTREVLAHVGSANFWDNSHQGQVDNCLSKRSPGSTLKPFLYALAFDQGHLIPDSVLLDVPTDFAGYTPENYGRSYLGLVTARDALSLSLNVPAARLLSQCGLHAFYNLLGHAGLSTIDKPPAHYGLSLALGGCEVRLIDLVTAYTALVQGGSFQPFVLELDGKNLSGQSLFSPEASRLTLDILSTVTRPTQAQAWEFTRDMPAVAWKTGTSFGHRDAWAIGLSQDLAIGVWVGNPDGSQCQNISGVRHAGPLLFDLFRTLARGQTMLPQPVAPRLITMEICSVSGCTPGPFCPVSYVPAIAGVTTLPACHMHKRIFVHQDSGLRLHGECLGQFPSKEQTIVLWPPELVAYQRAQGVPLPGLPALHPQCLDIPDESGPVIQSPSQHTPYLLRTDAPASFQRLALLAAPAPGGTKHYWYVDSRYVGQTSPEVPCFVSLESGKHEVLVTDNLGRSSQTTYLVTRNED